jgi:ribosomal protein L1
MAHGWYSTMLDHLFGHLVFKLTSGETAKVCIVTEDEKTKPQSKVAVDITYVGELEECIKNNRKKQPAFLEKIFKRSIKRTFPKSRR